MFLNIHFGSSKNLAGFDANPGNITFKLTIDTTLGYFELPNYKNNGIAGPLLPKDPHDTCSDNEDQFLTPCPSKRSLQTNENSTSFAIGYTPNLGPLAMIVAAMFEPGSFIATQIPQKGITPPDMLGPPKPIPCTIPPLNLLFNRSTYLSTGGMQSYNQPFHSDD